MTKLVWGCTSPPTWLLAIESEPEMASVEVRSRLSLEELLRCVAQLDPRELEQLIARLLALRAQRLAPSLADQEAGLLEKINQGLSAEAQQRFDELTAKRRAETLIPEEHRELLASIERIERADAERAQALIALAQLRKVSVEGLTAELGIRLPTGG